MPTKRTRLSKKTQPQAQVDESSLADWQALARKITTQLPIASKSPFIIICANELFEIMLQRLACIIAKGLAEEGNRMRLNVKHMQSYKSFSYTEDEIKRYMMLLHLVATPASTFERTGDKRTAICDRFEQRLMVFLMKAFEVCERVLGVCALIFINLCFCF
jgi:hypothetical protein